MAKPQLGHDQVVEVVSEYRWSITRVYHSKFEYARNLALMAG